MQSSTAQIERQVRQALQGGQINQAQAALDQALASTTDLPDRVVLLYLQALTLRLDKQAEKALDILDELLAMAPEHARGFQERGYCLQQLNDEQQAAIAFYRATQYNPALVASWRQLLNFHAQQQNQTAHQLATKQLEHLTALPPPVLGGYDLFYEGQLHKAEQVCRQFLQTHKHHPEAMVLLAKIALEMKVFHEAEFLLESCVALYPELASPRSEYLSLLTKLGKFQQAHDVATQALQNVPNELTLNMSLANSLVGLGKTAEACEIYHQMLQSYPQRPAIYLALGHALKAQGELPEAIDAYRQATELTDTFGDAWWSLANTKTYQFRQSELTKMADVLDQSSLSTDDAVHLHFALGKAYEDKQEFERSFQHYHAGNELKAKTLGYSIEQTERAMLAQRDACCRELMARKDGYQAPDPIFIVGLPRAGSTLLEQILASHSQVDGTMELHDILGIAARLSGQSNAYPFNLHELSSEQCRALGEQYIKQTQVYRQGAPYFIDKMPNNFIHLGLIHRILPNAKIIDARREPMACCFSGFKQLFAEGQEFSYSLKSIGRYYRAYEQLMAHWHDVMPGAVLTVQHEDVVDDLAGQVARILEFCELPFEDQCVHFHETKRVIKTPSSEQVRQPIYRSGLRQWENYSPWLQPLQAALK